MTHVHLAVMLLTTALAAEGGNAASVTNAEGASGHELLRVELGKPFVVSKSTGRHWASAPACCEPVPVVR